jgi:hypothetical protein
MSQRIKDEIAKFPKEFGLRGHKGRFTLSERSSYMSGDTVFLYTQKDGRDFCKGTPSELRREVIA